MAPVVATILTTIAAFLPMLLIGGTMGKFMSVLPRVVSFALLASLVEALVILPSHLAEWSPRNIREASPSWSERWLQQLGRVYRRFVALCLRWQYVCLVASLGITAVIVTFAVTHLSFVLFHEFESTQFFINIETPVTSKLADTQEVIVRVEQVVMETLPPTELRSLAANVGLIFLDVNRIVRGSNGGQLSVELTEAHQRTRSSQEIIKELRERTAGIPGATKIQYLEPQAGPAGPAIEIRVIGDDFVILQQIVDQVQGFLASFPAAKDIRDDFLPRQEGASHCRAP